MRKRVTGARGEGEVCKVEALLGYGRQEHPTELAALKLYNPRAAGLANEQQALARLRIEIDVLRQNRHGLPKLLDFNHSEGWIATEYFATGTLEEHLLRYKGDVALSLSAFRSLVETVAALHKDNMFHLDIKPADIFVGNDRSLVLGDFGIAFLPNLPERLTFTNESVGPSDYMPPWAETEERFNEIGGQFDVYELGKVLWCMVAGRLKLVREWYEKPAYDLRIKFPNDPRMYMVNALLEKCLHDVPEKCVPNATELLGWVAAHLDVVRRGGQMLRDGVPRPCRICGKGFYQPSGDKSEQSPGIANITLAGGLGHGGTRELFTRRFSLATIAVTLIVQDFVTRARDFVGIAPGRKEAVIAVAMFPPRYRLAFYLRKPSCL